MRVNFTVNGRKQEADDVWEGESLLYVLRERMGLPGSKNACEQGECGSCTVRLDGVPVCSCLVAASTRRRAARSSPSRAWRTTPGTATTPTPAPAAPPATCGTSLDAAQRWQARPTDGQSAEAAELSPVQQAFIDAGAVQCGFCTPGLLVAADELLEAQPSPSDQDIREALSGNLCRCTGYEKILDAVRLAAARQEEAVR